MKEIELVAPVLDSLGLKDRKQRKPSDLPSALPSDLSSGGLLPSDLLPSG